MNKEETLIRKIERNIKYNLRKKELDINALRREFCTNNNFKQQINLADLNQSFTEPKKKKIDLRLMRYP